MSKRLIYEEDAIDALNTLFKKHITQFGYEGYEKADEKTQLVCDGISYSIGCVLNLPTAQPEIIRCKDCKYIEEHHYEENGEPPIIKYTCANKAGLAKGFQVHEWEFCSRAERKEDE